MGGRDCTRFGDGHLRKKVVSERLIVERMVNGIIKNAKDHEDAVEKSIESFDMRCNKILSREQLP